MKILGIETSCDETAAAVYETEVGILSNKLYSQIELHKQFGGVVPEIASRSHLEKIEPILQAALNPANISFDKISKLINLGYPGGPIIEKLAQEVNFQDFFKYPRATHNSLNFSFSGLKTAVMYDLVKREYYNLQIKQFLEPENLELKRQIAS